MAAALKGYVAPARETAGRSFRLVCASAVELSLAKGSHMSIREMFFGAWILEPQETVASDGSVHRPLGENPVGLLMYDSSGRVGVNMMRTGRPSLRSAPYQCFEAHRTGL